MKRLTLLLAFLLSAQANASVTVNVNGTNYTIPQNNEKGWGTSVTSWIQGVSSSTLQLSGGSFNITQDIDLGANGFGLKSTYYKSRSANPSATGVYRLANTDLGLCFRNAGNTADLCLQTGAADGQLNYNGVLLDTISGANTLTNKTISGASNTLSSIGDASLSTPYIKADGTRPLTGNWNAGAFTITASTFSGALSGNATSATTAGNVTGTVAIANGGTGQVTAGAGFNALSPVTTLGDLIYGSAANTSSRLAGNTTAVKQFLTQTGTGTVSAAPSWGTISAGDVPTLNQNTTGTASNVTGTVAIANGGSGQTTAAAAFNALAPATAKGGVIVGSGANTYANQAVGANGQVLTADSTQPNGVRWGSGIALNAPTVQKFLSASGTYTTPVSPAPLYIRVRMAGGGGGGSGGSGSSAFNGGNGGAGGNTTFGTTLLVANGGAGGVGGASGGGGAGGTSSLGTGPIGTAISGGNGGGGQNSTAAGIYLAAGPGGAGPLGGFGAGAGASGAGYAAIPNTGGGGGGGGTNATATTQAGGGGGAGGWIDAIIASPAATYAYAVGAGGTAGAAGTGGFAGGAGGSGYIEVTEYYQ